MRNMEMEREENCTASGESLASEDESSGYKDIVGMRRTQRANVSRLYL
jgi:hypothetical protein